MRPSTDLALLSPGSKNQTFCIKGAPHKPVKSQSFSD
jgi:hypothetical protein